MWEVVGGEQKLHLTGSGIAFVPWPLLSAADPLCSCAIITE